MIFTIHCTSENPPNVEGVEQVLVWTKHQTRDVGEKPCGVWRNEHPHQTYATDIVGEQLTKAWVIHLNSLADLLALRALADDGLIINLPGDKFALEDDTPVDGDIEISDSYLD